jgi:Zn-dependent protease with chaperone function
MDRADFVHLVRLSEQASADDSDAYRRNVAFFALLGYAWVVVCMLAAVGMLWWTGHTMLHGRIRGYHIMAAFAGAGLLWTGLRALWFRLDAPEGVRIADQDAPALFEALERIRRKIKGPPIHEVFLTDDLNASICQLPRWGLFGGARNNLTLGLPLLMALDRQQLLAVLAHEYGHLRGDHGRFAAWVYRTRVSWGRFHEGLEERHGFAAMLTQGFLNWYFPRFVARTFAIARQDEYEADRIAARLLGPQIAAAALVEIGLKTDWLHQQFWRDHWALAATQALPMGPYRHMQKALAQPLPDAFARGALRQALRRVSGVDDTHPVCATGWKRSRFLPPCRPGRAARPFNFWAPRPRRTWRISIRSGAATTPPRGSSTTPCWVASACAWRPCAPRGSGPPPSGPSWAISSAASIRARRFRTATSRPWRNRHRMPMPCAGCTAACRQRRDRSAWTCWSACMAPAPITPGGRRRKRFPSWRQTRSTTRGRCRPGGRA